MEVVDAPGQPGKWLVLFNGAQSYCYNGIDCHGAAICAVNETWLADPSQGVCMCNAKNGFTGYNCDEWCGQAVAIVVINLVASIIALGLMVVSLYLLQRLLARKRDKNWHCNPVAITLILTSFGSTLFVTAPIVASFLLLGFPWNHDVVVLETGRVVKRSSQALEYASTILYALAYCSTVCSFVILPLTWIDVARNSLKLRQSQTSIVIGLTLTCVFVVLAILLPFYILMATGYRAQASTWVLGVLIGWCVIYPFTILLNCFALVRIQNVRNATVSSDRELCSAAIKQFLIRIQKSAIQIIIASVGAWIFTSFIGQRSTRELYTDPRCYADRSFILFRLSMYFLLYGCGVAIWFVAPSALGTVGWPRPKCMEGACRRKIKAARESSSPHTFRKYLSSRLETGDQGEPSGSYSQHRQAPVDTDAATAVATNNVIVQA